MKYKIKIKYETGDSFNSYNEEEFLEYEWVNLDKAKESLQRIKNHYKFYENNSSVYKKPKGKLPVGVLWDEEYRMIMLELMDDNGKPYIYFSSWTGYFETLESAEIVCSGSNDMIYINKRY